MSENSEEEMITKYEALTSLAYNFVHTAKSVGKIIIEEHKYKPEHKTILPTDNVKGQAGGEKYIYHGILFKFALDWKKIYNSDEVCLIFFFSFLF